MDEENKVEQPSGGLAAVSAQPVMQPPAQPMQTQQPAIDPLTKARIEYDAKRKELLAQQQKLIASLEQRISGPQDIFMAMAQGFGAPTRSGGFGESLSNALGGVSAVQKERRGIETDLSKMRLELDANELKMQKEDFDLAKTQHLSSALTGLLSGKASPEAAAASGITREQASLVASMPAEYKAMIVAQLQTGDVKGAIQELQKYMLEQTKEPEKIKELKYYMSQLQSPAAKSVAQQLAANNYFLGSPAERSKAILEIKKQADAGEGITKQEADILIGGLTSVGGAPAATTAGPSAAPAATPASAPAAFPRISTEEQSERDRMAARVRANEQTGAGIPTSKIVSPKQEREIETERLKTRAGGEEEDRKSDRSSLKKFAEQATQIKRDADTIFDLAEKNPNAYGVFSKPGFGNAFLTAVENGVSVGNFSVGLNDLQSVVLRAGGTQKDIDAVSMLLQTAVRTQLDLAAGAKGSVSNFERELFGQASYMKSDSPTVLKYKADLARAHGEFHPFYWNKFKQYEKSTGGSPEDFKESEGKKYIQQYDKVLEQIRKTYIR